MFGSAADTKKGSAATHRDSLESAATHRDPLESAATHREPLDFLCVLVDNGLSSDGSGRVTSEGRRWLVQIGTDLYRVESWTATTRRHVWRAVMRGAELVAYDGRSFSVLGAHPWIHGDRFFVGPSTTPFRRHYYTKLLPADFEKLADSKCDVQSFANGDVLEKDPEAAASDKYVYVGSLSQSRGYDDTDACVIGKLPSTGFTPVFKDMIGYRSSDEVCILPRAILQREDLWRPFLRDASRMCTLPVDTYADSWSMCWDNICPVLRTPDAADACLIGGFSCMGKSCLRIIAEVADKPLGSGDMALIKHRPPRVYLYVREDNAVPSRNGCYMVTENSDVPGRVVGKNRLNYVCIGWTSKSDVKPG